MKKYGMIHLSYVCAIVSVKLWSILNYVWCRLWGVKIQGGCKFRGLTRFRVFPEATLAIGKRCEFLSGETSNLMGLQTPCMLSTLTKEAEIVIGNDCGFSGTVVAAALSIRIGNNVRCGANTLITDTDWHTDDPRTSPNAPVCIHNNVWLGYNVKVLKGVTIGENSLIGACSVVTKNIPANVIAAGNPCRVIRAISPEFFDK